MPYRALTEVLLGQSPAAQPGDILPDTYADMEGREIPVDFERLVEIGAAEKVTAATARKAEKEAEKEDS